MQKTIDTYHRLNSYQGQANVDMLFVDGSGQTVKHVGSASRMKFQRPNRLYLSFSTPAGSRFVYSDGSHMTVYDASPKRYTVGPTALTLNDMLPLLFARAQIASALDPLFFLSASALPPKLTNLTQGPTEVYNGRPCFTVSGVTPSRPPIELEKGHSYNAPMSTWKWWIDKNSYMIQKIETRTSGASRPVQMNNGRSIRTQVVKGTVILRHTITDIRPDSRFPESSFTFHAPEGSVQQKTPDQQLGAGR